MEVHKLSKKSIVLELTPIELEILRGALTKEVSSRKKSWKIVEPKFPEELMYHAVMKDTAEGMKVKTYNAIKKYREWNILK